MPSSSYFLSFIFFRLKWANCLTRWRRSAVRTWSATIDSSSWLEKWWVQKVVWLIVNGTLLELAWCFPLFSMDLLFTHNRHFPVSSCNPIAIVLESVTLQESFSCKQGHCCLLVSSAPYHGQPRCGLSMPKDPVWFYAKHSWPSVCLSLSFLLAKVKGPTSRPPRCPFAKSAIP